MKNMRTNIIKTYSELINIDSFEDRLRYLSLDGIVGERTFGSHRYLNQILYNSTEWKDFKRIIIVRDGGFNLAHEDHPIFGAIYIHHINPITIDDILNRDPKVFDEENVISTSLRIHNAIHYEKIERVIEEMHVTFERKPFDTCPWR